MLIQFFLFCISLLVTFYFPGRLFLRLIQYPKQSSLITFGFAWGIGVALFLLGMYALSWIHTVILYFTIIGVSLVVELPFSIKEWKNNFYFDKITILQTGIFLLGVISMVSLTWNSGFLRGNELVFYGANSADGIYHLSVIGQMLSHFPPVRPNLSGIPLRGYHFFYDFLVANLALMYKFSLLDLIYRLVPCFIAFFYGISGLTLAKAMKFGKKTAIIFLFFLFFAQESRLLLGFFIHMPAYIYNSGIIQPLGNILDPSVVISASFLFLLGALVVSPLQKKQSVVGGIFLGILPIIKIYAGILGFIGILATLCIAVFQKKSKEYIFLLIIASGIVGATYGIFNLGSGGLVLAPFLLYRHFIEGSFAFARYQWALKYQVYDLHHNTIRIFQLYVIAFLLFFLPTLGIRFFGVFTLSSVFKKSWYTPKYIFWFSMSIAAILLGSLFIQTIGIFNTIQFLWFLYIFLLIPASVGVEKLLSYKNLIFKSCIIALFVLLVVPDTIYFLTQSMNSPLYVDANLLTITKRINEVTSPNDAIMVINRTNNQDEGKTSIYSALTQRRIYYETWITEFKGGDSIVEKRRKIIDLLSTYISSCKDSLIGKTLATNNTKYLFVHNHYACLDSMQSVKLIAHSGIYYLYQAVQ